MVHAIRIHENGGPDVLKWEEVEVNNPGPEEIRIRHTAIGLNYIDTYLRTGARPLPMPSILGLEAAGVVEEIGSNVTHLGVGDRVSYADMPVGAYSEERVMPAHIAVKIPEGIDDAVAAAAMLKGMTTQFLIRQLFRVEPGMNVLLHAAAGGVGLITSQWLNHLGATVIGTVGSKEKAKLASENGVHHVINYNEENFVERVKDITDGKGVPVVYDGVGKDTLTDSMKCLSPLGMLACFGNASGAPDPVNIMDLSSYGSIFITRPMLFHYTATRQALEECANDLFEVINSGAVKIGINQTYPLKDTAQAHKDLEGRKTTGSTVLIP
ncbi:MAG: quinone oxidoreductase [Alphaproteobacteria bacterium]|jgi:NADPH2:quinone reductase|nr:quinone oxidoreductase [Alphaproteobacteria bacterium]PPR14059.1 MAG: 2-haloacrylate reductase [Alphaproteobacteria bacterium MarineAlpha12_Bin1]|tara:strand:+ start:31579 stop:32553 length:975 start_codon:yes stop_codon:yes gene_type:complete